MIGGVGGIMARFSPYKKSTIATACRRIMGIAFIFAWTPMPSHAANCADARTPFVHILCTSRELAELNKELSGAMEIYLDTDPDTNDIRTEEQNAWRKQIEAECRIPYPGSLTPEQEKSAIACLAPLYRERLRVLRANASAPAPTDPALCHGVAERIIRDRENKAADDLFPPILERLRASDPEFIELDLAENVDPAERLIFGGDNNQAATAKYHFTRRQIERIGRYISGFHGAIRHLGGGSSVFAVDVVAGTLYCHSFNFFEASSEGAPHSIKPPADDEDLCGGDGGYLGAIAGQPAFFLDKENGTHATIAVSTRAATAWRKACRLDIEYEPVFDIAEMNCKGSFCEELRRRILPMVGEFHATGEVQSLWREAKQRFPDWKTIEQDMTDVIMPAFTDERFSYWGFDSQAVRAPLVIDGEIYVLKIGHGRIRDFSSDDYVVALLEIDDYGSNPIAGVAITLKRGRIARIEQR